MTRARLVLVAAFAAGALSLASCSSSSSSSSGTTPGSGTSRGSTGTTAGPGSPGFNAPTDPFYQAPNPLPPGKPGDVIRTQPLTGAPNGASAWKVLYHSTSTTGADIAVSGIVVVPSGPAPTGGRPVLAWAHPTTGVVDDCAPSALSDWAALIPGFQTFLAAGYVIAATDYEGLGTAGVHPYLIGQSEGQGVLDSARAARNLPEASASADLLIFGHSQGGQASLFAGQLASSYAPELHLEGVAAAAPAGELGKLLSDDAATLEGVILGSYAINAWGDVYGPTTPGADPTKIVEPAAQPAMDQIVALCNILPQQYEQQSKLAQPIVGNFFVGDPASTPPWTEILDRNSPGREKTNAPVFITQGTADAIVIPSTTAQLAQQLCGKGDDLRLQYYPGVPHDTIGYESAADVASWMAAVRQGQAPASMCGSLPPAPATPGSSAPAGTTRS